MSKNSPYISWRSIANTGGTLRAIGCAGFTVQTSSRSSASRHRRLQLVPIRRLNGFDRWPEWRTTRPIPSSTRCWTAAATSSATSSWKRWPHQVSTSVVSRTTAVEAVTRVVERRGPNLGALAEVLADRAGDRLVHPVRIDLAHVGVGLLDAVLAPDGDANWPLLAHEVCQRWRRSVVSWLSPSGPAEAARTFRSTLRVERMPGMTTSVAG